MRSAVCFCISAQWNLQRFRQTLISSGKLKFMNRCRLQAESSIFVDFRSISNLRVFSAKGSSTAGLIYDASRGPLAGQTESPRSDQTRNACRYGPMQHTHTQTRTHTDTHTHTHTHTNTKPKTHTQHKIHTHTLSQICHFFLTIMTFFRSSYFLSSDYSPTAIYCSKHTSSFCLSAVIVTQNHWTCKTNLTRNQ